MSGMAMTENRPMELDDARMRAWIALLQAHASLVATLEDELQRTQGLSLSAFEVLIHLDQAPAGELRMQDLAHAVLLSKSGLTRLIDRIEAAGQVTRRSCPADRRGTYAVITPEGRAALEAARPEHFRAIQQHFGRHLDDADTEAFLAAMDKVLAANGWSRGAAGDCGADPGAPAA